uniref:Uncharacterized protein n=1 Tax=Anguilla anguilla TaxID=7936 RepID=A0A0E9TSN9_ANGAN
MCALLRFTVVTTREYPSGKDHLANRLCTH